MIGEKGLDQTDHNKKGQRKQEQKKSDKGDKERTQEQTKTSTPKDRKWRSWQWSTCCFMPLNSIGAALKVRDGEVKLMRGAKCRQGLRILQIKEAEGCGQLLTLEAGAHS